MQPVGPMPSVINNTRTKMPISFPRKCAIVALMALGVTHNAVTDLRSTFLATLTKCSEYDSSNEAFAVTDLRSTSLAASTSAANTTRAEAQRSSSSNEATVINGYVRSPVIYGHIHMAKTAGTSLTGEFAAKYERVCGHKGYSHDSFQTNKRRRQFASDWSGASIPGDTISNQWNGFNRG